MRMILLLKTTKYIGKIYYKKTAYELSKKYNWSIKEQEKGEWRRVVPSPNPLIYLTEINQASS